MSYNPEKDLQIYAAMVNHFADFINSDTVYYQMNGLGALGFTFPKLTLGGLLFAKHKCEFFQDQLSATQREELANVTARLTHLRSDRTVAIENKAIKETNARVRSWKWYVDDALFKPKKADRHYNTEVNARVYLHYLMAEIGSSDQANDLRKQLKLTDDAFSTIFKSSKFSWKPAALEPAFPKDPHWYLYGTPTAGY